MCNNCKIFNLILLVYCVIFTQAVAAPVISKFSVITLIVEACIQNIVIIFCINYTV